MLLSQCAINDDSGFTHGHVTTPLSVAPGLPIVMIGVDFPSFTLLRDCWPVIQKEKIVYICPSY